MFLEGDQLRGQHINFTFVEVPHFLEFVRDPITDEIIFEDISSGLLFKSDYRNTTYGEGFLNDMLGWISHHAGFTYSAYIASGRCENDGNGLYSPTYSNNYKVASTDVFEDECTFKTTGDPGKGRTDAYLGMFFITNDRMTRNDFTIPFLSNKGLSIALPKDLQDCKKGSPGNKTQTFVDSSKLLQPFSNELWYGIIIYLLFACFLLMIVEGSNKSQIGRILVKHESELTPLVQNTCNEDGSGFKTKPVGEGLPHGYLTVQGIHEHFLYYFFRTFQSILAGNELPEVLTAEGRVMNIWLAICSVVILAAYTANLTVFLIADVPHTVEGISDLIDRNIPTYLPSDSAFSDWVVGAYPQLNTKYVENFQQQITTLETEIMDGKCRAVIAPDTNLQANGALSRVDGPWAYGYKDHSIGVRKDFGVLRDTLDFWIHQLILAPPLHRHSSPWSFNKNSYNMEQYYNKWVCAESEAGCSNLDAEVDETAALGLSHFSILWSVGQWLGGVLLLSTFLRNLDMIGYRLNAVTRTNLPILRQKFDTASKRFILYHCVIGALIGVFAWWANPMSSPVLTFSSAMLLWCILQTPSTGGWVPLIFMATVVMAAIWTLVPNDTGTNVGYLVGGVIILLCLIITMKQPFRESWEILPEYLSQNETLKKYSYDSGRSVRIQEFMAYYDKHKYNSAFQKGLTDKMLEYYVQEDVATFRLLKHTKSLLQKYLPLLDQLSSTAGRDTIHGMQLSASYVSQVVHSATTTVDALLWRALREGRETRRHKNVSQQVNKNKKVLSKRRDTVAVLPQNGVEAEGGENDNQHQRREMVMKQEDFIFERKSSQEQEQVFREVVDIRKEEIERHEKRKVEPLEAPGDGE